MTLVQWKPFRELETLHSQMDRLFEGLLRGSDAGLSGLSLRDFPLLPSGEMSWMPAIELKETDQDLILKAEIPGIEAKDLNVEVTEDSVSISGEHREEQKTDEKGYFRSEFHYGKFQRSVPLPVKIRNQDAKAEFKSGILTLTCPKAMEEQRKVVKVNLSS
jgi:HSP20 family protein